jgi:hypothetical protein
MENKSFRDCSSNFIRIPEDSRAFAFAREKDGKQEAAFIKAL